MFVRKIPLAVVIPAIIFALHALVFRAWIVDDAGISFVYARNLAEGHGLVAQPGQPAVEGYSNTLWVLLWAPFFVLDLFDPLTLPKIVSVAIVWLAFGILDRTFARVFKSAWTRGLLLVLLALNSSFVIWTTSGLENPLYVLLICGLFELVCRVVVDDDQRVRVAYALAVLAAGIALTRPDGIMFAGFFPFVMIVAYRDRRAVLRQHLVSYGLLFALIFGSFLLFRRAYFGAWVPNTYYVKGGPDAVTVLRIAALQSEVIARALDLFDSTLRGLGGLVLAIMVIGTTWQVLRENFTRMHWLILGGLFWTLGIYLLLPQDWMAEYRFATPFFVFYYAYLIALVALIIKKSLRLPDARRVRLFAYLFVVLVSVPVFAQRSQQFSDNPTISFDYVQHELALTTNDWAERLALAEDASILAPDLGGLLYFTELEVIDLAGLVDRTIAYDLYSKGDQAAFYDYIFETKQPTLVYIHSHFAVMGALNKDDRFERDYRVLCGGEDETVAAEYGVTVVSGYFIRRDAVIAANQAELVAIQRELGCEPTPERPAED